MDKFDVAQQTRQAILDLANSLGNITSRIVVDNLEYNMDHAYRSMTKMVEAGELDKHVKGSGVYFTPLKTITQSSEEMRSKQYKTLLENRFSMENRTKSKRKKCEPWRTIHLGSENPHPIPSQGGQSSSGINSWSRANAPGWV